MKLPKGLPSLLSTMASLKSMVYVVFSFSESSSSMEMCRPEVLISGISICGGEIITFSCAFSTLISSSKVMVTFFACCCRAPMAGCMATIFGGVSS